MSTGRKTLGPLAKPHINASAKRVSKVGLDERKADVVGGGAAIKPQINGVKEVVTISSDSSSEEEEDEDEDEDEDDENVDAAATEDVSMEDAAGEVSNTARKGEGGVALRGQDRAEDEEDEEAEEPTEPSFGDLIRANAPGTIDVAGAFEDDRTAVSHLQNRIQPPFGASLGTVLSQALRTNDVQLLESCLHTSDVTTIRATIQRLDSPLAGALLQKLAERLHRRPGRAGSLMAWVQWTLVTHGGYLASQKDLISKLTQLNRVIDERAQGLQSLLNLKGKLDMLEAQIQLRKSMQKQMDDDVEDEGIIYVEGEESEDGPVRLLNGTADGDEASDASDDLLDARDHVIADSEEEEDDEDADSVGGFLDDEAEESDASGEGDEDEVDFEDQDSDGEDVESDDDVAPPSKMQRIAGSSSSLRRR